MVEAFSLQPLEEAGEHGTATARSMVDLVEEVAPVVQQNA